CADRHLRHHLTPAVLRGLTRPARGNSYQDPGGEVPSVNPPASGSFGQVAGPSLKRRLAVLLGALVVVGSVIGAITAWAIVARDAAADEVRIELLPAQVRVDEVYNGLIDQETGVRGFVLTGDEGFLEPYAGGGRRADAALA